MTKAESDRLSELAQQHALSLPSIRRFIRGSKYPKPDQTTIRRRYPDAW